MLDCSWHVLLKPQGNYIHASLLNGGSFFDVKPFPKDRRGIADLELIPIMSENEQIFNKNLASRGKNAPGRMIFEGTKAIAAVAFAANRQTEW